MTDFNDFMGFGEDELEKAEQETTVRNLTAGTYKVMIEKVSFMNRAKGVEAFAVEKPSMAGTNLSIEIACLLIEDANGFNKNWKHTIFLRPVSENDIAARIGKAQLNQLCKAASVPADQNLHNALIGKIVEIELVVQKNNPDYTNLKEIRPVGMANTQKPAVVASTREPDWGKKAPAAATTKTTVPDDWN